MTKFTIGEVERDRFLEVAGQVAEIKRLDTRTTLSDRPAAAAAGSETLDAAIDATLDNLCPGHVYLGSDCSAISGK